MHQSKNVHRCLLVRGLFLFALPLAFTGCNSEGEGSLKASASGVIKGQQEEAIKSGVKPEEVQEKVSHTPAGRRMLKGR